jgi:hypothetical protein
VASKNKELLLVLQVLDNRLALLQQQVARFEANAAEARRESLDEALRRQAIRAASETLASESP